MLGEKIHQLRKAKGLSQEELASQLTISRQAISKWELGEAMPDTDNIVQLSKLFGVSTDYLLNDDIEISNAPTSAHTIEPSSGEQSNTDKNIAEENAQTESQKQPLIWDIACIIVAIFAAWCVLKIPTLFGYTIKGFFVLSIQVASVLYVPVYLFLIRPRKVRHIKKKELVGKATIINRGLWVVGTAGALFVCFLPYRHFFYQQHGNKDWASVMFIVGLAAIFISAFIDTKKIMVCTVAGYVISFIVGIVFNSYHDVVVNGEVVSTNSTAWLIWTFTFLVLIFAGIVWEIVNKRMKRIRAVL
jgi:transcriptional regulator with XRE-family HTH domain